MIWVIVDGFGLFQTFKIGIAMDRNHLCTYLKLMFVMNDHSYWRLGERLGQAWEIGKNWMSSADE
jgi:hypothetical protein